MRLDQAQSRRPLHISINGWLTSGLVSRLARRSAERVIQLQMLKAIAAVSRQAWECICTLAFSACREIVLGLVIEIAPVSLNLKPFLIVHQNN